MPDPPARWSYASPNNLLPTNPLLRHLPRRPPTFRRICSLPDRQARVEQGEADFGGEFGECADEVEVGGD